MPAQETRHPVAKGYERTRKLWEQAQGLLGRHPGEWSGEETRLFEESLEQLSLVFEELQVAEEELREQAEALEAANVTLDLERRRYREMFELAPDAYVITDIHGRIQEVNASACSLLGRDAGRVMGKPLALFVPAPERPAFRSRTTQAIGSPGLLCWDGRMRPRTGQEIDAEFRVSAARGLGGHVEALRWIVRDVTFRKHAESEIERARSQLQALASRAQAAREEERRRIAREIHDQLGGDLTALKIEMERMTGRLPAGPELAERAERMRTILDGAVETVRDLATQLRPPVLDLGLVPALEWQIDEFRRRTGIACRFTSSHGEIVMTGERATSIFRLVQEALTNIARHAEATGVAVSLAADPRELVIEVHDNGKGITREDVDRANSLGLAGMRERVIMFSGEMAIHGDPETGTTITIRVPLSPAGLESARAAGTAPKRPLSRRR